jgi:hypothetical protein
MIVLYPNLSLPIPVARHDLVRSFADDVSLLYDIRSLAGHNSIQARGQASTIKPFQYTDEFENSTDSSSKSKSIRCPQPERSPHREFNSQLHLWVLWNSRKALRARTTLSIVHESRLDGEWSGCSRLWGSWV